MIYHCTMEGGLLVCSDQTKLVENNIGHIRLSELECPPSHIELKLHHNFDGTVHNLS